MRVRLRVMATAEKLRKARGGFLPTVMSVFRAKKKSWMITEWKDVYLL